MKQLSPLDAQFFYMEAPHQPMVIAGLWLCDQSTAPNGLVRHKDILRFVSSRLSKTSLFRRKMTHAPLRLDDPYWMEDKSFDLEYHIRHVGLPQPGDWRQLCIFTARAMSRSLDMERAPWELTIIEGLNNVEGVPPGSFALLLRMHHAYLDGKSGVMLTTLLMDDAPDNEYLPVTTSPYRERMPSPSQMWARTLPRLISQPYRSAAAGVTLARKSLQLLGRLREEAGDNKHRVPFTPFNERVSPHRSFGGHVWKLADLKRTRRLVEGATLNDAIVAIIGGGMRRYLSLREALPDEGSLVALCPVSVRAEGAGREMGNQLSAMLIGMGTDIEAPIERLQAIYQQTQSRATLARDVVGELLSSASEVLPAPLRMLNTWLYRQARYTSKRPLHNTLLSNVPGPALGDKKQYFAGAQVLTTFAIGPICDGMALTHAITGIYDKIDLGVLADREILPDMDAYIDCIRQSTEEYLALCDAAAEAAAQVAAEEPKPATKPAQPRRKSTSSEPGPEETTR